MRCVTANCRSSWPAGADPDPGQLAGSAYAMVNVTANLLAFKFRQQYGIRLFAEIGLGLWRAGGAAPVRRQLRDHDADPCRQRFAGAACSTLGTLYMLQRCAAALHRHLLVVGVGLSSWRCRRLDRLPGPGRYRPVAPTVLVRGRPGPSAFAAVVVLKLPPGIQVKAFEPLDFLTFALLAPAVALLVIVLAQGYTRWWLNTAWLGWALIASIVPSTTALIIEHYRRNPLLQIRWLSTLPVLHFIVGAFLIRFLTTEQSYGVVNPDARWAWDRTRCGRCSW